MIDILLWHCLFDDLQEKMTKLASYFIFIIFFFIDFKLILDFFLIAANEHCIQEDIDKPREYFFFVSMGIVFFESLDNLFKSWDIKKLIQISFPLVVALDEEVCQILKHLSDMMAVIYLY